MRFCCHQCTPCYSLGKVVEDELYRRKKKHDDYEWVQCSSILVSQLSQCLSNGLSYTLKRECIVHIRVSDSNSIVDGIFTLCHSKTHKASAMVGSRTWFGGILHRTGLRRHGSEKFFDCQLNPIQEQRLQKLQDRIQVPFDENRPDHREALKALWYAAFPNVQLTGLISEQWKDMGWQGPNPSTDFRGCGFISLETLLFFARIYPVSFHRLLFKEDGDRATWEYPFAVAGINITFMLIQMLDLFSEKPKCIPGINFVKMLGEDEEAFDVLFCIAFEMMDGQWLAMHASYMQFNDVLQATRTQLERELSLDDVHRIHDLPAYNLLYK